MKSRIFVSFMSLMANSSFILSMYFSSIVMTKLFKHTVCGVSEEFGTRAGKCPPTRPTYGRLMPSTD